VLRDNVEVISCTGEELGTNATPSTLTRQIVKNDLDIVQFDQARMLRHRHYKVYPTNRDPEVPIF
jgi:hypothetical protein